jgi:hypothetical protein
MPEKLIQTLDFRWLFLPLDHTRNEAKAMIYPARDKPGKQPQTAGLP